MKKQFRTITHDRDTLAERIDSDRARQAKINDNHEATVAALQEDIRKLQATIARLELAQGHPPLAPRSSEHIPRPRSPVRRVSPLPRRQFSRSRSPAENEDFKRSRRSVDARPEFIEIVMGPVLFVGSLAPRQLFEMHLQTALPHHPSLGRYDVYRTGDYLRVSGLSSQDAQALIRAWSTHTVAGYKDVNMNEARGEEPNRKASGSKSRHGGNSGGSGYRPRRSYPSR
ncbi:hypothetical protein C8R45DRAFT_1045952 [Mycena sanguinolenta]|nr:hypothetical protein C8R45DRAFT_1045952 [Mycena sanguinolenta]